MSDELEMTFKEAIEYMKNLEGDFIVRLTFADDDDPDKEGGEAHVG